MKVAMITPWHVRCGIALYSKALASALAELGIDVYIVRLPRFGAKTKEILEQVIAEIPLDRIDIIHVQHEYGLYQNLDGGFFGMLRAVSKKYGKPIVTTMHAAGVWETDQVISDASDVVVTHNEYCARMFKHKSVIISHGLCPSEAVEAEEAKKFYGIPPEAPVVGYLGFISNYKGLEQLIGVMEDVKAALVVGGGWHVSGETDYIYNLKEQSLKALKGRCQWLGWVPEDKIATAYGAMDIIVYPSRFSSESGALLNAIAHGKAVLASRLPPFVEKEKKGALMTFKNSLDLKTKIKRLLKDEKLRRSIEVGAKAYAEKYRWENIAALHKSLYESLKNELNMKMKKEEG